MTWAHHLIIAAFLLAEGAAVGSFLNVCIWRLPRRLSLIRPRSRCPRCGSAIAARDNLPVVGWLLLGGRCRACRRPISARYPMVEALVAVLFAADYLFDIPFDSRDLFEKGATSEVARLACDQTVMAVAVAWAFIVSDSRASRRREAERIEAA